MVSGSQNKFRDVQPFSVLSHPLDNNSVWVTSFSPLRLPFHPSAVRVKPRLKTSLSLVICSLHILLCLAFAVCVVSCCHSSSSVLGTVHENDDLNICPSHVGLLVPVCTSPYFNLWFNVVSGPPFCPSSSAFSQLSCFLPHSCLVSLYFHL